MNTKLILAATALAVSMGAASPIVNAKIVCAIGNSCMATPEKGYLALGRVKVPHNKDSISNVKVLPLPIGLPAPAPAPAPTPVPVVTTPAPAPQPSGSGIDVNVDLGGGYGNDYNDGISCGEGRSIVRHSGFRKVRALDCSSDVFTYSAKKHNQFFKVFVNTDGNIVHVSNFSY